MKQATKEGPMMSARPYLRVVQDNDHERAVRDVRRRIHENQKEYERYDAMVREGRKGCARCLNRSLDLMKEITDLGEQP